MRALKDLGFAGSEMFATHHTRHDAYEMFALYSVNAHSIPPPLIAPVQFESAASRSPKTVLRDAACHASDHDAQSSTSNGSRNAMSLVDVNAKSSELVL